MSAPPVDSCDAILIALASWGAARTAAPMAEDGGDGVRACVRLAFFCPNQSYYRRQHACITLLIRGRMRARGG